MQHLDSNFNLCLKKKIRQHDNFGCMLRSVDMLVTNEKNAHFF